MNEELKIIIKAVTDQARKEVAKVRKEIEEVEKSAKEAEKVTESIKSIGKGALAAVAGVVALTTALSNLGKSALEFSKAENRLKAGFQSAGASAEQAQTTFRELFRFLGDTDKALETSNLLAQLTTDEKELAEWTTILQGVYAALPDSIPTEALAESANETAKVGQITGALADALNWVGVSEDAFNAKLAATNSEAEREALIRSTLLGLYGQSAALYERNSASALAYNDSQYRLNSALASTAKYTTPLLIALNNMAATLLQAVGPAIGKVVSYLVVLIQWITTAASYIASFFGAFSSGNKAVSTVSSSVGSLQSNISGATSGVSGLGGAFDGATKAAEKLKRTTAGFDELNIVKPQQAASAGAAGGGGGGGAAIPDLGNLGIGDFSMPDMGLDQFKMDLEDAKGRMQALLVLAGAVGAAILAWKVLDAITNPALNLGNIFKDLAGKALMVAGALLTVVGYSDAWVNGVGWGNLAVTLAGIAAVIAGLYLSFGGLAASIGTVAAGVALLVLGVKDFISNGMTAQNTILILGGAIAVAVGLATAGVSVLVSAIVGVVTAVAAFTAAILLEESAIMSTKDAQEALTAAKERAAEAELGYVNAVDAAEASMKRLEDAEKAAGITGEELYAQVQNGTLDYADMTDAQKEVYKAYIDNEKKQKDLKAATEELNAAKKAETLASYENQLALAKESGNYDDFKKSVVDAYKSGELSAEEARTLIEKAMSEMSDASQQTFMEDIPGDIKDGMDPSRFETTRKKIGDWFSKVGTAASEVFTKLKTTISTKMTEASNGIKTAVDKIKNFFKFDWSLPKIKLPHFSISGKFSLDPPSIPKFSVSWYKMGGVFDTPTLFGYGNGAIGGLGENGAEAIVPLENNLGWLDKLADMLSERMGSGGPIIMQVDGKTFAQVSVDSINSLTKQTGSLQLSLV